MQPTNNNVSRDYSLDGLRGVAALSVLIFHFFCAFVPHLVSEYDNNPWSGSDTPLAIFYNGGFAVSIFFVLSGFVISRSAAKSKRSLIGSLVLRYLRLALPVTAATLLAWALLSAFPLPLHELRLGMHSRWIDYVYDGDLPGFPFAIYHGMVGVFREGGSKFNNALWTMKIELFGSCLLYLAYWKKLARFRLYLLVAGLLIALVRLKPEYGAFAIGALLQEYRASRNFSGRFGWGALFVGLFFGAMMQGYAVRMGLAAIDNHLFTDFKPGEPHKFFQVFAATLVMYSVLSVPALRSVLSGTVCRFLGRISFGLYLVHVPIIFVGLSWLYASLPGFGREVVMFGLFAPVALLCGYLFTIFVDEPIVSGLHRLNLRYQGAKKAIRAAMS
jgi:peptidoglycan/LPS O-acetylase OafA/YrhL